MSTRPYRRRDDVVLEVEHLLTDRSAASITTALGYTRPGSVARAMYRAGRPDLARPFNAADFALRAA